MSPRWAPVAVGLWLSLAAVAHAAPSPLDRARELRAHTLFRQIRCVVCQNESIDDSEAPLAGDLRGLIREQIAAGRSDVQIRRFLTDRYGEFVLLKPRVSMGNALLWLAPFAIVAAGVGVMAARRSSTLPEEAPLSAEEASRLVRLEALAGAPLRRHLVEVTLPPNGRLTKGSNPR